MSEISLIVLLNTLIAFVDTVPLKGTSLAVGATTIHKLNTPETEGLSPLISVLLLVFIVIVMLIICMCV
uniref:Uncharacterized protein n=1 Tax=Megaselia scalaris TaxID=36166 RepID=T1GSE5_MEGSC